MPKRSICYAVASNHTQNLVLIADQLRVLRNMGAHANDEEVESYDVPMIEEFIDAIFEYLYVAPHKFTRLKKSLKRENLLMDMPF